MSRWPHVQLTVALHAVTVAVSHSFLALPGRWLLEITVVIDREAPTPSQVHTRRAIASRPTSAARSPALRTSSQISPTVLNSGSTTYRHDGWPRKSKTARSARAHSTASRTALRNHSSFHRPERKALMSLIGLIGTSTSPFG